MPPHPTSSARAKREFSNAGFAQRSNGAPELSREPATSRRRLNTSAAADYCGLACSTFEKFRVSGRGPKYLKLGRRVVYDVADLEAWLASSRRRSTSDGAETVETGGAS